jgi:hypothetical protein
VPTAPAATGDAESATIAAETAGAGSAAPTVPTTAGDAQSAPVTTGPAAPTVLTASTATGGGGDDDDGDGDSGDSGGPPNADAASSSGSDQGIPALLEDSEEDDAAPNPEADDLKRRVLRAAALVREGYVGRAARSFNPGAILPPTPEVREELRRLHPEAQRPIPPLPPANQLPPKLVAIDHSILRRLCKRIDNGAAPGPSGWTGAMIRALMDDPVCMLALSLIVLDIGNGELQGAAEHDHLLAARLLGVEKKPDQGIAGNVRPIAIPEVILKLALMYLMALVSPALADHFGDLQLAVGTKGGPEIALAKQRHAALATEDGVSVETDSASAFQLFERADLLNELHNHPEALGVLTRVAHWGYGTPTDLVVSDAAGRIVDRMQSKTGARQGDVLASVLYTVTSMPTFKKVDVEAGPTVSVTALTDDVGLAGPWQRALLAFELYVREAAAVNRPLNLAKCCVNWPRTSQPPAALSARCLELGLELHVGGHKINGSFIGEDDAAALAWAHAKVDKHDLLFEGIMHADMPVHSALKLLTMVPIARMVYVVRSTPTPPIRPALRKFDDNVLRCFTSLLGRPPHMALSPAQALLVRMPVGRNFGGLGLRRLEHVAPAAYIGGALQAMPHLARHVRAAAGGVLPTPEAFAASPTGRFLTSAIAELTARGAYPDEEQFPTTAARMFTEFADVPPAQAQKYLSTFVDAATKRAWTQVASPRERAHRISCAQPNAQAYRWLDEPPLSNAEMRSVLRHLMHMGQDEGLGDLLCACGTAHARDPTHALSCRRFWRRALTWRHTLVQETLQQLCSLAGWHAELEVPIRGAQFQDDFRGHGSVLDLLIHTPYETYGIDVSGINPNAQSYVQGAASQALHAAGTRAAYKVDKYAAICALRDIKFLPFVFEAPGALHLSAVKLLKDLATALVESRAAPELTTFNAAFTHASRTINAAIHKGNAAVFRQALMQARVEGRRGPPRAYISARLGGWRAPRHTGAAY